MQLLLLVTIFLPWSSSFTVSSAPHCSWNQVERSRFHRNHDEIRRTTRVSVAANYDYVGSDIQIDRSNTDHASINRAARFMVDAYWLNSPLSMIAAGSAGQPLSDVGRSHLVQAQGQDLVQRYGKHEGLLHSYLFAALGNDNEVLGLVGMEVRLCDRDANVIHSTQTSEQMLKGALSTLTVQKQRHVQENNTCVPELVNELLPSEIGAVCVLSNLCVSPKARRKGLATKLCLEAERAARTTCGCRQIYLEVEEANVAAKSLYQDKLGFELQCTGEAPAKRVDPASGNLVSILAPTVVLSKQID